MLVYQSNALKEKHGTSKGAAVNASLMSAKLARFLTKKPAIACASPLSAHSDKNSSPQMENLIVAATVLFKNAHATSILTLTNVIVNVFLKNAVKTSTLIQEIVNAIAKSQQMTNALRDISGAQIPAHASAMHPKFAMM